MRFHLHRKYIILCLKVLSVDDLWKPVEPRSGTTICRAWSGFKLFDTLMAFLKEFFEKDNNMQNYPACK